MEEDLMREITRINRQKFVNKIFRMLEDTGLSHTDARHYLSKETGIKVDGVAKWATGRVVPREPALGKLQSLNRALMRDAKGRRSLNPVVDFEKVRSDPNGRVPVSDTSQEVTILRSIYEIANVSLSKSDKMALANMLMVTYLSEDGA